MHRTRQQLTIRCTGDLGVDDLAFRLILGEGNLGEVFRAPHAGFFDKDVVFLPYLFGQVSGNAHFTRRTQRCRAGLDRPSVDLRHAGRRRARAGAVGEHMQER